jgi:hypothetical protein
MTATWQSVGITVGCSTTPAKGTIKLPRGRTVPADKLLVRRTPDGSPVLLDARLREDGGKGACLEPSRLAALGSEDALIDYRKPTTFELYRYQPRVIFKSFVAVLTFVGALIAGYSGFLATADPKTNLFDVQTAAIVLVIAFVEAASDLWTALSGQA